MTTEPRVGSLPEHVAYRDDGCSVSPSCLHCPLPVCRYDVHGGVQAIYREQQRQAMLADIAAGLSATAAAAKYCVTLRTVYRALAKEDRT